ncbi:MlaA family lipoprotein [Sphingobium nicotianae]|nr:VacJ family lipoprotein [Sphingobium nicotianae]
MKAALLVTAALSVSVPAIAQGDQAVVPAAHVQAPVETGDAQPRESVAPLQDALSAPQESSGQEAPPADEEEIVVTGRGRPPPEDPLQAVNVQTYQVTQKVDVAVVAPAAKGYKKILPEPVRAGVRNFFNNLAEPTVFLNYLLQLKVGKAFETAGRFGLNSTIGVAGLFDRAKHKPFNLPLRRNGFANTFGFYGIKPGPFLFVPLVGPTTVRDLIGLWLDKAVLPVAVGPPFGKPYYVLPATLVGTLDYRVEFDEQLRKLRESPDPYAASREFYLKGREAEIEALRHPHAPPLPLTPAGPLVEPAAPAGSQPTAPPQSTP